MGEPTKKTRRREPERVACQDIFREQWQGHRDSCSGQAQAIHPVDVTDKDRDTRCHAGWWRPCVQWPGDKR